MPPNTRMMAATSLAVSAPAGTAVCCFASSFMFNRWQARRESNPQPAVLETAALPIELLACGANYRFSSSRGQAMSPVPGRWLLEDLRDHAGADGATTLTDGEAQAFLHRDRVDQLHHHFDVVARHHHFGVGRQLDRP